MVKKEDQIAELVVLKSEEQNLLRQVVQKAEWSPEGKVKVQRNVTRGGKTIVQTFWVSPKQAEAQGLKPAEAEAKPKVPKIHLGLFERHPVEELRARTSAISALVKKLNIPRSEWMASPQVRGWSTQIRTGVKVTANKIDDVTKIEWESMKEMGEDSKAKMANLRAELDKMGYKTDLDKDGRIIQADIDYEQLSREQLESLQKSLKEQYARGIADSERVRTAMNRPGIGGWKETYRNQLNTMGSDNYLMSERIRKVESALKKVGNG